MKILTTVVRWPLHYQILAALVLGSVIGALINPGTVALDRKIQADVRPLNGHIVLTETDAAGVELLRDEFPNETVLRRRYPGLARRYQQHDPRRPVTVPVADPRVHIVEDGKTVTLRYMRQYGEQQAIKTYEAPTAEEFVRKFPQWKPVLEKHGGGVPRQVAVAAKLTGDLFLRLLQMITVPLIVTSLVTGVAGLGDTRRFGSMFGKTLLYYVGTSLLAISTGLLLVNVIRPGHGALLPGGGEPLVGGEESLAGIFRGLIEQMIPANPVESLAGGEFLSIITFSILLGVVIIYTGGEAADTLRRFFDAGFKVMMRMTLAIIRLAPIGVLAFMLFATATQGLDIFKSLVWYLLTVLLALLFHATVVLPLILKFVAKRSPWEYAQAMSPALMTAFSTASSNGTLPLTITCAEERAGISNEVSSFILPLGATINMDGTALYEAVAVLFIAQAYAFADPTFTLTFSQQLLVAVTALLASIGAAGIPYAGLVMMAIVLQAVGLPLDAQGIIIAVDRVLDMCRTSVNVWSDSCGCAVLSRFEERNRHDTTPSAQPNAKTAPVS